MRFVAFFGAIVAVVGTSMLLNLIPDALIPWIVPGVIGGSVVVIALIMLWQECSQRFPPKGDRS